MEDMCRFYANNIPFYVRHFMDFGSSGGPGNNPPWMLRG
jgi:hypothetical protein